MGGYVADDQIAVSEHGSEEARSPASGPQAPAARGFSPWDLLPLAWLALCLFAYGTLVLNPVTPDRETIPGLVEAERLALPLLCVLGIAAIIRYFASHHGQPRRSHPEPAAGQDTV